MCNVFFKMAAFNIFSLSLVFSSLIIMCLGVVSFEFILFRIYWASHICKFMSFTKFGEFSKTLSPFLWDTNDLSVSPHKSLRLCLFEFSSLFCRLEKFYWFTFKFYQGHPVNSFFFFNSDILCFRSKIPIWFLLWFLFLCWEIFLLFSSVFPFTSCKVVRIVNLKSFKYLPGGSSIWASAGPAPGGCLFPWEEALLWPCFLVRQFGAASWIVEVLCVHSVYPVRVL